MDALVVRRTKSCVPIVHVGIRVTVYIVEWNNVSTTFFSIYHREVEQLVRRWMRSVSREWRWTRRCVSIGKDGAASRTSLHSGTMLTKNQSCRDCVSSNNVATAILNSDFIYITRRRILFLKSVFRIFTDPYFWYLRDDIYDRVFRQISSFRVDTFIQSIYKHKKFNNLLIANIRSRRQIYLKLDAFKIENFNIQALKICEFMIIWKANINVYDWLLINIILQCRDTDIETPWRIK